MILVTIQLQSSFDLGESISLLNTTYELTPVLIFRFQQGLSMAAVAQPRMFPSKPLSWYRDIGCKTSLYFSPWSARREVPE